MRFNDCIVSARDQGVLSAEEADDLLRRYDAHRRANAASPDVDELAKAGLAKELDTIAANKRRVTELTVAKQAELTRDLSGYRGVDGKADLYEAIMRKLENFGFSGYTGVANRAKAIVSVIHGEMADMLRHFERSFYLGVRNKAIAGDVVRAIHGAGNVPPEAKAFATAVEQQFESLRQRFNAAGGSIGELKGGYLPHSHDPRAVMAAGYADWRDFILPKLDLTKMRDPITGGPLSPVRLGESLKAAYDNITSDGWLGRTPSSQRQGAGATASQRADHRFLHFKSVDDWMDYDRAFGHGDPIVSVFQHINGMARDIAAMETLGPNPTATVEWFKQLLMSEHAKMQAKQPSLFINSVNHLPGVKVADGDAAQIAAQRVEDLWRWTNGRRVVSQGMADGFSAVRNVLTSAQLGSAVVTAATTDPVLERSARQALGMSQTALLGANVKVYADAIAQLPLVRHVLDPIVSHMIGAPRDVALRSGMIADEFLHIMGDEVRYAQTLGSNVWSRWLADRTVTWSGLAPLTEARKAVLQLEMQGFVADLSGKAFAALPERMRAKLEGYGFDAAQWDTLRATAQYRAHPNAAGLVRPVDVAATDRNIAERYVAMLLGETERAVPSGTLRSKAFILGEGRRGDIAGEMWQNVAQYKSFGLSIITLQAEAVAQETARFGAAQGASYAAQMFTLLTIGGALALQLKNIANGRDPQNIRDPKFALAAMATGGGLGIFGDFLFADYSRFGHSLGATLAGPVGGLAGDLLQFTAGNALQLIDRKGTGAGTEFTNLLGRYVPFISSAWYTRLAYRRELLDQLQYQLDPRAHRRWREAERKSMREKGQGEWWPSGATAPARAPQLTGR